MEKIKGWFLSGSHPQNYEMGVDYEVVHEGQASGYLTSQATQSNEEFATMMQQFKADNYIGKRVRLTSFIKTEEVDMFASMWMRVDDRLEDVVQFDNMSNRPIVGTTDWNMYSIVLDIPENSAVISFGVLIQGEGKLWVDCFVFDEVSTKVQTTAIDVEQALLDEPMNLSFEL